MALSAIALNCSLKGEGEASSTDKLLQELIAALHRAGADADGSAVRVADFNIKPGVSSDEGDGDEWPALRKRILSADILIVGTPIWLGQPSSVAKRVLERMDAFLGEADERGRTPAFGKVAVAAVVGNEDGAHHCHAELFQALNDVGFTVPAAGGTYWVGQAMGSTDYKDLDLPYEKTRKTTLMVAANAVHLAKYLKATPFPGLD